MFRIKFKAPAINKSVSNIFDLPAISKSLFEIINIEKNKLPIRRNLNELIPDKYSSPKKKFIICPGKKIIRKKSGRFIIKIHFPICILNFLIKSRFFFACSLVIIGNKSCINNSGASVNRAANGIAAL